MCTPHTFFLLSSAALLARCKLFKNNISLLSFYTSHYQRLHCQFFGAKNFGCGGCHVCESSCLILVLEPQEKLDPTLGSYFPPSSVSQFSHRQLQKWNTCFIWIFPSSGCEVMYNYGKISHFNVNWSKQWLCLFFSFFWTGTIPPSILISIQMDE